jgi:hypothetical protein
MKRKLFIMVAVIASFSTITAQTIEKVVVKKDLSMRPISKEDFSVVQTATFVAQKQPTRVKQTRERIATISGVKSYAPADASTFLVGNFIASGEGYWDGSQTWDVTIRRDASDQSKYWIENIMFLRDGEPDWDEVYGTLTGTTLNIPLGQKVGTTQSGANIVLFAIDDEDNDIFTGNIVATVNETAGTITFNLGPGAIVRPNSYYQIVLPGLVLYSAASYVPNSFYSPTKGTLFYGIDDSFSKILNAAWTLASPHTTWNFENLTPTGSFSWAYGEYDENDENGRSENASTKDLAMNVNYGEYFMPQLTTTVNANSTSYINTVNNVNYANKPAITMAGGTLVTSSGDSFNAGLLNLDNGITTWRTSNTSYLYGTGVQAWGAPEDSIFSVYDIQSPLFFTGVDFYFNTNPVNLAIPNNTEFTASVFTCKRDEEGFPVLDEDPIGVATLRGSDIDKTKGVMRFQDFIAIDAEGFETQLEGIDVDQTFAIVLSGFNSPGVTLALMSEETKRKDAATRKYTYFTSISEGERLFASWNTSYTLYSNLVDAVYTYFASEVSEINAKPEGEIVNFTIVPLWSKADLDGTAPNWISIDQTDHFEQEDWGSDIKLTIAPNTTNANREAQLTWKTLHGGQVSVTVKQSSATGISATHTESAAKALRQGDNFRLFYPASATSVSVYNIAGQRIAEYKLNTTGTYTLPATNLAKGVYILKFNGEKSTSVKILK